MITNTISKRIAEAMKAGDEVRLSTLRMLSAELHNAKIDKRATGPGGDLTEDEEIGVVKKEAKKRKDAIEVYEKAGANEKAEQEKKELEILQEYLPEELSDEELFKLVDEAIKETGASSVADMGKVMGSVMKKTEGRSDGKRVSETVRKKLAE